MHPLHLVAQECEVRYHPLLPARGGADLNKPQTAVRSSAAGRTGLRSTREQGAPGARALAACDLKDVEGLSGACREVRLRDLALADALDAVLRPHNANFSFIEYGSGVGFIGTSLASVYPGSSIISVESDKSLHQVQILKSSLYKNFVW